MESNNEKAREIQLAIRTEKLKKSKIKGLIKWNINQKRCESTKQRNCRKGKKIRNIAGAITEKDNQNKDSCC